MKTYWRPALCGLMAMLLQAGLRAATLIEYRFDEIGPVATNSALLGNLGNGVLNNVSRFAENHPFASGSCVEFNGVNSFIRVNNSFGYGSQVTVEAWIKPSVVTGQRVLWDDYGNPGVLLAVSSGVVQFNVSTTSHPGGGIGVFTGALVTNVWQHVAGVYDGATLRVYVNGQQAPETANTSGNIIENGNDPAIGSDNATTTALNFAGRMDDFRIHTHALTADELAGGAFVRLNAARVANQVVLSWRTNAFNFQLRSSTNLASGSWSLAAPSLTQIGGFLFATNLLADPQRYYRLQLP